SVRHQNTNSLLGNAMGVEGVPRPQSITLLSKQSSYWYHRFPSRAPFLKECRKTGRPGGQIRRARYQGFVSRFVRDPPSAGFLRRTHLYADFSPSPFLSANHSVECKNNAGF